MTQENLPPKQAYSVDEAVIQSGIKRVKLYSEIKSGRLISRKCGSRTLILAKDLQDWLNSLPTSNQNLGG